MSLHLVYSNNLWRNVKVAPQSEQSSLNLPCGSEAKMMSSQSLYHICPQVTCMLAILRQSFWNFWLQRQCRVLSTGGRVEASPQSPAPKKFASDILSCMNWNLYHLKASKLKFSPFNPQLSLKMPQFLHPPPPQFVIIDGTLQCVATN